jgi:hypothetical protein
MHLALHGVQASGTLLKNGLPDAEKIGTPGGQAAKRTPIWGLGRRRVSDTCLGRDRLEI